MIISFLVANSNKERKELEKRINGLNNQMDEYENRAKKAENLAKRKDKMINDLTQDIIDLQK